MYVTCCRNLWSAEIPIKSCNSSTVSAGMRWGGRTISGVTPKTDDEEGEDCGAHGIDPPCNFTSQHRSHDTKAINK